SDLQRKPDDPHALDPDYLPHRPAASFPVELVWHLWPLRNVCRFSPPNGWGYSPPPEVKIAVLDESAADGLAVPRPFRPLLPGVGGRPSRGLFALRLQPGHRPGEAVPLLGADRLPALPGLVR